MVIDFFSAISMTSSSFSRSSTAPTAVPSSVRPSIAAQHRPTDHRHRDDISRRRNDATNSRPTHLNPTGLTSSATASSQTRTRPARIRPASQSSSATNAIDVLMPLLQALFRVSILQPSEGLLDAVNVIRRQVADALHATKATSANASAQPAVSWWCPCCRRHHEHTCCSALARVSP